MKIKLLAILFLTFISSRIVADTWKSPETKNYFSENRKYFVKVFPTSTPEKYYKWRTAKPKKKSKFSEKDTTIILCHAILYKIEGADTIEIWKQKLINRIAPETVIVANDGKSIVTFNNWGSVGYGIDVMVTYDEFGGLVKRYQLEDFSPFPINHYEMSISSLWWCCGVKYIDNQKIEICFRDEDDNVKNRIYNIKAQVFE